MKLTDVGSEYTLRHPLDPDTVFYKSCQYDDHPVQRVQDPYMNELSDLRFAAAALGTYAPFTMLRERNAVSTSRRLPPLKSSLLSLDVLMGKEDQLDFSQIYNVERPDENQLNQHVHELIEKRIFSNTF